MLRFRSIFYTRRDKVEVSSFHESIDGQSVHVYGPIWPPCALPLLATVQALGDFEIFPLCVEAGLVEVNLGDLVFVNFFHVTKTYELELTFVYTS